MAIFKKVTSIWENDNRTINIKNINISATHLGNEQQIIDFLDKIALLNFTKDYTDNELSSIIYDFIKQSPRINKVLFYKNKKTIIAIIFTDILLNNNVVLDFSQEISLKCENGFSFSMFELSNNKNFKAPKGWKELKEMNKTFDKIKAIFQ